MDNHLEHECVICGEHKSEGQGIRIISGFICEACEQEMVRTDVRDAKYPFFINQMKQIFLEKNA